MQFGSLLNGEVKVGTSSWISIPQDDITDFVELTRDSVGVHRDEEEARRRGFPRTIVPGLQQLSLISQMILQLIEFPENGNLVYDSIDSWQFLRPVLSEDAVRCHFEVSEIRKRRKATLVTIDVKMEIQSTRKLAAEGSVTFAYVSSQE